MILKNKINSWTVPLIEAIVRQLFDNHFDEFEYRYDDRFSREYGFIHPVSSHIIRNYLHVGTLSRASHESAAPIATMSVSSPSVVEVAGSARYVMAKRSSLPGGTTLGSVYTTTCGFRQVTPGHRNVAPLHHPQNLFTGRAELYREDWNGDLSLEDEPWRQQAEFPDFHPP
jgi:hypothetical protein